MLWHCLPTSLPDYAAIEIDDAIVRQAGLLLCEPPAQYQPRHPERTGFYQLFETHFDNYVRTYEERFEAHSGPLRPVVVWTVEAFLDCGCKEVSREFVVRSAMRSTFWRFHAAPGISAPVARPSGRCFSPRS